MTNYDAWKTSGPREGAFTCDCGEVIREGEARCYSCDESYRQECVIEILPTPEFRTEEQWGEDLRAAFESRNVTWTHQLPAHRLAESVERLCVRHHELLESSKETETQLMETIKSLREEMKRRDEIRPNLKAASPS